LLPGEQAQITLTLANRSATANADITGGTLSLTVGNQTVTANLSGDQLGPIAAGASKSTAAPFALTIPAALRCGTVAQLQLQLTTSAGAYKLPVRIRAGRAAGATTVVMDDNVDAGNVAWKRKKGFDASTQFA